MDETKVKLTINNIIRHLIIFMIILLSLMVVVSIMKGVYDFTGVTVGLIFIFVLIVLKWLLGEMNID